MTSEVMDSGFPLPGYCGVGMTAQVSEGGNMMKKSVFSQWFVVLLLFAVLVLWASVSTKEAAAMDKRRNAPASNPTVIATIKQIGQDMGDAMVAGDIEKLNQI